MNWVKRHKILTAVIAFLALTVIVGVTSPDTKKSTNTDKSQTSTTTPKAADTTAPTVNLSLEDKIKKAVPGADRFEITLTTPDGSGFKEDTTPPPYAVVINGTERLDSCTVAKMALFDTMKNIYTDNSIKDQVARVRFTAPGYLTAGIGSKDATAYDFKASSYSALFIDVSKLRTVEDKSQPPTQQTYATALDGCK